MKFIDEYYYTQINKKNMPKFMMIICYCFCVSFVWKSTTAWSELVFYLYFNYIFNNGLTFNVISIFYLFKIRLYIKIFWLVKDVHSVIRSLSSWRDVPRIAIEIIYNKYLKSNIAPVYVQLIENFYLQYMGFSPLLFFVFQIFSLYSEIFIFYSV